MLARSDQTLGMMSGRAPRPRRLLGIGGGFLLAGGQAFLVNVNEVVHWLLPTRAIRWLRPLLELKNDTFPPGVFCALVMVIAGALLVAAALPLARDPEPKTAQPAARPQLRLPVEVILALSAMAALTVVLLWREPPANDALLGWLALLGTGLGVAIVLDRPRACGRMRALGATEAAVLLCIGGAAVIYTMRDAADWHWAGLPDESFFYVAARDVLAGRFRAFALSQDGVFGYHPALATYYQAAWMALFGSTISIWRLSSVAALAAALPALYVMARDLAGRRVAYLATILFAGAQLALTFAHLGYNNILVYPVVLGAFAAMLLANPDRGLTGCYVAGTIAGFGFFTFYLGLAAVPLVLLCGWTVGRLSLRRDRRADVIAFIAPILICALPSMTALSNTAAHAQRLLAPTGAAPVATGLGAALHRVLANYGLALVYGLWFPNAHHLQSNPIVDPFTGALAAVGVCMGVRAALHRQRRGACLAVAYLFLAFAAGAINPYERPPLTRLLILVPFTCALCAVALDRLAGMVARPRQRFATVAMVIVAALAWNIRSLHRNVYELHHGFEDGTTAELVRLVQQLPADAHVTYLEVLNVNADNVAAEYGFDSRLSYLHPETWRTALAAVPADVAGIVAHDARAPEVAAAFERDVQARFAGADWCDSDPGRRWNLRYTMVQALK